MAKKFVNVKGLHNIFVNEAALSAGTIASSVASTVDENSILYIEADSTDETTFPNYKIHNLDNLIYAKGKLVGNYLGSSLKNLSNSEASISINDNYDAYFITNTKTGNVTLTYNLTSTSFNNTKSQLTLVIIKNTAGSAVTFTLAYDNNFGIVNNLYSSNSFTLANNAVAEIYYNELKNANGVAYLSYGVNIADSLLPSTAIGSTVSPIYWTGSLFSTIGYTIAKSVPSTASFDTLSISKHGSGNALTSISVNGHTVDVSFGSTFLTTVSIPDVTVSINGTGNAIATMSASGHAITATLGSFAVSTHNHDSSYAGLSHSHGNISNTGTISASVSIATGDRLVIRDNTDGKITTTKDIVFDGTTTTSLLSKKGEWVNAITLTDASNGSTGLAIAEDVYNELIDVEEVISDAISTMADTLGMEDNFNVSWSTASGIPSTASYKEAIEYACQGSGSSDEKQKVTATTSKFYITGITETPNGTAVEGVANTNSYIDGGNKLVIPNASIVTATISTLNGASVPVNPVFTDEKVKQTSTTSTNTFPMLASNQVTPTSGTAYESIYSSNIKIKPSVGQIIANQYNVTTTSSTLSCVMYYDSTDRCVKFSFNL